MVSHFQSKNSQIVAPLTEIVAFFEKKIQGVFWRFSGQKRALSDSKHLATLFQCSTVIQIVNNILRIFRNIFPK